MSWRFNVCNPCCGCTLCATSTSPDNGYLFTLPTIAASPGYIGPCTDSATLSRQSFLCYHFTSTTGFCCWYSDPFTLCGSPAQAAVQLFQTGLFGVLGWWASIFRPGWTCDANFSKSTLLVVGSGGVFFPAALLANVGGNPLALCNNTVTFTAQSFGASQGPGPYMIVADGSTSKIEPQ